MQAQFPILIASYPRSGNHLLRAILEYATQRPTLGCPGALPDTPIHTREPNRNSQLITIAHDEPVGLKIHSLRDFAQWEKQGSDNIERLLLLTRDPVDAISSHLLRDFRNHWFLSDKLLRRSVSTQVSLYLETIILFCSYPETSRRHVSFSALTGPDAASHATMLLQSLGIDTELTDEQMCSISAISRDSQKSLEHVRPALAARVKREVAANISYEQVQRLLHQTKQYQCPQSNWR